MSRHEPEPQRQRLLGRLHAGLHADHVADLVLEPLVQLDQEVDRARSGLRRRSREPRLQRAAAPASSSRYGASSLRSDRLVRERIRLGLGLEEEVERIDHRHVGDEIDLDEELRHLLGKHDAREVVAVRILLPVQEVALRLDLQRVAQDRRAACGAGRKRITCGPISNGRSYW